VQLFLPQSDRSAQQHTTLLGVPFASLSPREEVLLLDLFLCSPKYSFAKYSLPAMRPNVYPSDIAMKRDEIRLIRLLPGSWNDVIRCELVFKSLCNIRPYHTLSYVWGSRNKSRRIELDGHDFYITTNLVSALQHLRQQLKDTLLWSDALSINQTDDGERTRQVNLMGRIYRLSQGVLVYLGDSKPRCRRKTKYMTTPDAPPVITFPPERGRYLLK
jgi:hypothetical protein